MILFGNVVRLPTEDPFVGTGRGPQSRAEKEINTRSVVNFITHTQSFRASHVVEKYKGKKNYADGVLVCRITLRDVRQHSQ